MSCVARGRGGRGSILKRGELEIVSVLSTWSLEPGMRPPRHLLCVTCGLSMESLVRVLTWVSILSSSFRTMRFVTVWRRLDL